MTPRSAIGWKTPTRCGCDPIVLVFNNASWEMLRTFEPSGRFQLLDIHLAPGVLSPTLERFVKAVKRLSMPD